MKFVCEYQLLHRHTVQVGVEAESADLAKEAVETLLEVGEISIHNTESLLLMDEFEEEDGQVLEIKVIKKCSEFPKPDASVAALKREALARRVCEMLVAAYKAGEKNGGDMEWDDVDQCHEVALQALREGHRS